MPRQLTPKEIEQIRDAFLATATVQETAIATDRSTSTVSKYVLDLDKHKRGRKPSSTHRPRHARTGP